MSLLNETIQGLKRWELLRELARMAALERYNTILGLPPRPSRPRPQEFPFELTLGPEVIGDLGMMIKLTRESLQNSKGKEMAQRIFVRPDGSWYKTEIAAGPDHPIIPGLLNRITPTPKVAEKWERIARREALAPFVFSHTHIPGRAITPSWGDIQNAASGAMNISLLHPQGTDHDIFCLCLTSETLGARLLAEIHCLLNMVDNLLHPRSQVDEREDKIRKLVELCDRLRIVVYYFHSDRPIGPNTTTGGLRLKRLIGDPKLVF